MPAQWTAKIIGEMHLNNVSAKQLAQEVGWHPKYLSRVLNGHTEPKGAEDKLKCALERIKKGKYQSGKQIEARVMENQEARV